MVAGLAADLNPLLSPSSSIRYYSDPNANFFTVRWQNVAVQGTTPVLLLDFDVTLWPSGRAAVRYYSSADLDSLLSGGSAGTRPLFYAGVYADSVQLASATTTTFATTTAGLSPGTLFGSPLPAGAAYEGNYLPANNSVSQGSSPPKAALQAGTTVVYCPASTDWVAYPRYGPASGGNAVRMTTPVHGCLGSSGSSGGFPGSLSCSFGGSLVAASYDARLGGVVCSAPAGDPYTTVAVAVLLAGVSLTAPGPAVFYSYVPAGEPRVSTAAMAALSADPAYCATAAPLNPAYCVRDCAGVYRGGAWRDDCVACVGGNTGRQPGQNKDCQGLCYGPFLSKANVTAIAYVRDRYSFDDACACAYNPDAQGPYAPPDFFDLCAYHNKTAGPFGPHDALTPLKTVRVVLSVLFIAAAFVWLAAALREWLQRANPRERGGGVSLLPVVEEPIVRVYVDF
jgi:hypothetical protein